MEVEAGGWWNWTFWAWAAGLVGWLTAEAIEQWKDRRP